MITPDVIVVGAGIAGLAAAAELARRGRTVLVLEGRKRVGGRILTLRRGKSPAATELGAQFVHGGSPPLTRALRAAGIKTRVAPFAIWWKTGRQIVRVPDFWDDVGRVADHIPTRDRTLSIATFLRQSADTVDSVVARQMRHYVESFNAASAQRLSAAAIGETRASVDTRDLAVLNGYDRLVRWLHRRCRAARVDLRLGHDVRRLRWRRGHVTVWARVNGRRVCVEASAAIITAPLGVLRVGHVRFEPPLVRKRAAWRQLGWGCVIRIVLRFRREFRTSGSLPAALQGGRGAAAGFVQAPDLEVPVWWAAHSRTPVLVGWAGGPAADRLRGEPPSRILAKAVASLARVCGKKTAWVRRRLAGWGYHDWTHDPFSRGAYSFPAAGAGDALRQYARPEQGTLFFAGEATAEACGTVHGALGSGMHAARECLRSRAATPRQT